MPPGTLTAAHPRPGPARAINAGYDAEPHRGPQSRLHAPLDQLPIVAPQSHSHAPGALPSARLACRPAETVTAAPLFQVAGQYSSTTGANPPVHVAPAILQGHPVKKFRRQTPTEIFRRQEYLPQLRSPTLCVLCQRVCYPTEA